MSNHTEPRNANEARIRAARESFAAVDTLWAQPVTARKSDTPVASAPSNHLSGLSVSTMKSAEASTIRKADALDVLPASIKDRANGFDAGQKALLAYVYATHAKTGRPVPIDAGEASRIMSSTPDKATAFIGILEARGFIAREYSSLGPLLGFTPAIGA